LGLLYTFGLSANAVLQRHSEEWLSQAVAAYQQQQQRTAQQDPPGVAVPSRLFTGFCSQAGTWERARYVVAKAEANAQGTNRRFVGTNRPGAALLPAATYDA
jgi:hypothetical protein